MFYHSYSHAALIYEVQAAIGGLLSGFDSSTASLPRLIHTPFGNIASAKELLENYPSFPSRDHEKRFREVAICATTSLLSDDPEATPRSVFLYGYSCLDVSFWDILQTVLEASGISKKNISSVAQQLVQIAAEYGLTTTYYNAPSQSYILPNPGHLLQIFVRREIVDKFIYASLPYGVLDQRRMPLSQHLESSGVISGQVRICFHPSVFMNPEKVKMYVYHAEHQFDVDRPAFQRKLLGVLKQHLEPEILRESGLVCKCSSKPNNPSCGVF